MQKATMTRRDFIKILGIASAGVAAAKLPHFNEITLDEPVKQSEYLENIMPYTENTVTCWRQGNLWIAADEYGIHYFSKP